VDNLRNFFLIPKTEMPRQLAFYCARTPP